MQLTIPSSGIQLIKSHFAWVLGKTKFIYGNRAGVTWFHANPNWLVKTTYPQATSETQLEYSFEKQAVVSGLGTVMVIPYTIGSDKGHLIMIDKEKGVYTTDNSSHVGLTKFDWNKKTATWENSTSKHKGTMRVGSLHSPTGGTTQQTTL